MICLGGPAHGFDVPPRGIRLRLHDGGTDKDMPVYVHRTIWIDGRGQHGFWVYDKLANDESLRLATEAMENK